MTQRRGGRPYRAESRDIGDHRSHPPRHDLSNELTALEGTSYGRYKSLRGKWWAGPAILDISRVQSDPYAPPSRVALEFDAEAADLIADWYATEERRRALAVLLAKRFKRACPTRDLRIDAGGQEILRRASCTVGSDGSVVFRLGAQFPGHGRRIAGRQAARLLCEVLPDAADEALSVSEEDVLVWTRHADDVRALREAVGAAGLVAFVADGAMLARRSGVDDRPMESGVPFASPESMAVEFDLPHAGTVRGMGIGPGVTLIVGGGFHGKSTLLRALESGVWDHVPGDGRDLVVADRSAVKIRAEDGRAVTGVDVHAFVDHLPSGDDTRHFTTENASGSTSQAAGIVEALEAGAKALLIDEDTAATNLMIRDARMQELVAKEREPLTPLVDLVRSMADEHGVATILVMGGSGDYMDVADRVILMDAYRPEDVTERAKALAAKPTGRRVEAEGFRLPRARVIDPRSVSSESRGKQKIKAGGTDGLRFGESDVDVRSVEQITDPAMTTGIGLAIEAAVRHGWIDGEATVEAVLDRLDEALDTGGEAELLRIRDIDLAVPRRHEVAATLNRMRELRVRQSGG
ncbi:ABC-ATPase domain-containing protein [Glycomyces luteolus]|uniref:ABC-ATPase domain-containing protein n=1 Tax=Glycomyces luteolus TaxID=2670330 RepID=A0A9X3PBZ1_9ACTN|nr:ABC-ATPase domain-containing protein [Glycomyces luteolus]MDA1360585.1 ABC-ATPase domain-containing protein [Glycomyces luteolus]